MGIGRNHSIQPAFFKQLVLRQVRQDYLDNLTGFAWLVLQPLVLLAVYAFVFTQVFSPRVPESMGIGFVPFLAVAFWPWIAFSEAILKASNSITSNAALVTKVAFAREQLPLAVVTATFLMHTLGYLVVLVALQLLGTDIYWMALLLVLPLMVMLWVFACGIALLTSATQVFLRDVGQILPPLMTFWFFMTPILYSTTVLPSGIAGWMKWNPMTWFMEQLRSLLLAGEFRLDAVALILLVAIVVFTWLALRYFRRFSGHFEDFL